MSIAFSHLMGACGSVLVGNIFYFRIVIILESFLNLSQERLRDGKM